MKVAHLVPREKARVEQSVVERLESMLEKAKNGQFAGIAIVALGVDGSNFSSYSASIDRMKMIGLLDWIKWRMLSDYDKDD